MSNEHMQKHTLWLRKGDWDYIQSIYKSSGISTSLIVRTIVSQYVDQKREEENAEIDDLEVDVRL